ncbi:WRKY DNA-binding transcription factor 70-like [Populus alba x Populus x berolinensis]|nr:WRKY DNA-binding transcription factor 70-like [Populus alba x Populus x berolinensis]
MGTFFPEKLSSSREMVIKELVQGHEFATQLQIRLQKPCGNFDGRFSSAGELVGKILRSFSETLSVITSSESAGGEICQNLASSLGDSACYDDRRSEDSGESTKRPATKDRRGCYKRKKISQSWTTVCPTIEDSHAWRKYGQKGILNAKYPRSYFGCIRKYEQGCKAKKQVQRMEDNPDMYHTTYIGSHTCRNIPEAPQIITDSDPWESYNLTSSVGSHSKIPRYEEQDHHPIPGSSCKVEQESKEDQTPSTDLADNVSSLDSFMWKDLIPVDEPPMMRSDYEAVDSIHLFSCTEVTSQSLDMDFVLKSFDFDCDFHFD